MMKPPKVGPKSVIQKIQNNAAPRPAFTADLGDESVNSDSSSCYETTGLTDGSDFRSPELANEAYTDYGLDFTSSRAINPTVADEKISGQDTTTPREQHPVQETGAKSVRKSTVTTSRRKTTVTTTSGKSTVTTAAATSATTKKQHRRKQKQPQAIKEPPLLVGGMDFLVPRLPFSRVVREIMQAQSSSAAKITKTAMEALQISTEAYVIQRMQDAYLLAIHRGRVTLSIQDMILIKHLRNLNQ